MRQINIIFITLALFACGGGSQDQSQAEAVVPGEAESLATGATRMNDLRVGSDFDFIGGETLDIVISNQVNGGGGAYINVCTDFTRLQSSYEIDYDSCVLRTRLNQPYQQYAVTLSPSNDLLLAQVWSLEDGAEPVSYLWNRAVDGQRWQIDVN